MGQLLVVIRVLQFFTMVCLLLLCKVIREGYAMGHWQWNAKSY